MFKNKVLALFVLLLLVPQVTFASWWNPLTWFKPVKVKQNVETLATPRIQDISPDNPVTKTTNSGLEDENQKLKKELADLKRKNTPTSTTAKVPSANNVVKKQEITTVPTNKTCLNGSVVLVSELCVKSCPDGEVIVETLNCRPGVANNVNTANTINPTSGGSQVNDICTSATLKSVIEDTGRELQNTKNSILDRYNTSMNLSFFQRQADLARFKELNIPESDVSYKQSTNLYNTNVAVYTRSRDDEMTNAQASYNTKILDLKVKTGCSF